ncbi:hypothetical protein QE152_g35682 [Popillia japonica]|uniref:Uncharacterized protein n=1 Tax=Popillia japonica TaxID=7064 RepID=A0AAW1IEM9_POPJA
MITAKHSKQNVADNTFSTVVVWKWNNTDLRRQNMECRYRSPCSTQKFPVDTSARTRYIPFHFLARGRNLIGNMKPSGNGQ